MTYFMLYEFRFIKKERLCGEMPSGLRRLKEVDFICFN